MPNYAPKNLNRKKNHFGAKLNQILFIRSNILQKLQKYETCKAFTNFKLRIKTLKGSSAPNF